MSHNILNDMTDTDVELYNKLIESIFHFDLCEAKDNKKSIILFTAPLSDFVEDPTIFVKATVNYIQENHRDYLLYVKKHPRDQEKYEWDEFFNVVNIDANIPGELILENMKFEKEYYMMPSNILMLYGQGRNTSIFKYETLKDAKRTGGGADYFEAFEAGFRIYQLDSRTIDCIVL